MKKQLYLTSMLFLGFALLSACASGGDSPAGTTQPPGSILLTGSSKGGTTGHPNSLGNPQRRGQDCVACHLITAGPAVTLAGSVFDMANTNNPKPDVTVQFYTQPAGGGTLVYEIQVNSEGNFYATNDLSSWPASGLYAYITEQNNTAKDRFMNRVVTASEMGCNKFGCHDASGVAPAPGSIVH